MLVGTIVTRARQPAARRCARRACRRSPPCARARRCPRRASRATARSRAACSRSLGFAALAYGLFGSGLSTTQILLCMGLGTVLIFFGVALLSARIARPLARVLGWPAARLGGAAGALARDNAQRNPQRTASTASALMIGLALVTLVAVLAAGITSSFRGRRQRLWTDGYAITAEDNFSPIPIAAGNAAAQTPGVEAIANVRGGDAQVFGKTIQATGAQPAGGRDLQPRLGRRLRRRDRRPRRARRDRRQGLREEPRPEGRLAARRCSRRPGVTLPLAGARDLRPADGRLAVRPRDDLRRGLGPRLRQPAEHLLVRAACRAARRTPTRPRSSGSSQPFPNAKVQTKQEFIDNQIAGLNAILNILYVLLALSVDRQPVRDREHARAHRLRAHARARDAARDRDDAPPGAADDPPRERDHRADRRRDRDRARDRARRAARRAGRLHRLLAAGRPADRLRDRDDRARHRRGDLPGAARRAAERARRRSSTSERADASSRRCSPRTSRPTRRRRGDLETMRGYAVTLGDPFSRHEPEAHFTASAVVVDEAGARTLLVHHAKSGNWFQPGGHIEPDDASLAEAALREAREETGPRRPARTTRACSTSTCTGSRGTSTTTSTCASSPSPPARSRPTRPRCARPSG